MRNLAMAMFMIMKAVIAAVHVLRQLSHIQHIHSHHVMAAVLCSHPM